MKYWLIFLCLGSHVALAQSVKSPHPKGAINCKTCHTCEYPTVKEPCLIDCPREDLITIRHSAEAGPNVIKMDFFKDRYAPVVFSHRLHAQMFDMAGGCGGCHHYNTSGPVLSCRTCHEPKETKTELGTPSLLAAYHRQCINCHREWSHETGCQSCHALSTVDAGAMKKNIENLKGKTHKVVTEPVKLIFETDSEKGKLVTFYHKEHTQIFGQSCVSCHKQQNCVDCHDVTKNAAPRHVIVKPTETTRTEDEKHEACYACHKGNACSFCHSDEEKPPFDHARRSGWALKVYHTSLSCRNCHPKEEYTRKDHACASCHTSWSPSNFKHSVVGLKLDDDHALLDCEDCHAGRKYEAKPSCSNCHDDKMYPRDKPGVSGR